MSLPLVLRSQAREEFDDAFDWYNQSRAGLGAEFVAEVDRVLDRIAISPLIYREVSAQVRRACVRRFPYCVLYRCHSDRIEVLAVFHTSRDDADWRAR